MSTISVDLKTEIIGVSIYKNGDIKVTKRHTVTYSDGSNHQETRTETYKPGDDITNAPNIVKKAVKVWDKAFLTAYNNWFGDKKENEEPNIYN